MDNLLQKRNDLSRQGLEIFILPAKTSKYYVEVYNFKVSVFPILQLYLEGDNYDQLLSDAIENAQSYLASQ